MRGPRILAILILAAIVVGPAWGSGGFPPLPSPVVQVPEVSALMAGRAWSVSTGIVQVPANNELDVVLTNPAGSGCAAAFTLRRLSNPNNTALAFQSFTNPSAAGSATPLSPGNRRFGDPPSSGLSFTFAAQAQGSMTGTPGVKAPLLANTEEDVTVPGLLLPGRSYGIALTALSGLLSSAIPLSITIVGYCA